MKRTIVIAASLALLPLGTAFAAFTEACPTASLLQEADDPQSCFKTGHAVNEERASAMRGAEGPVKLEMTSGTEAQREIPLEIRHSYGDPSWYR